jgi:hypothetical protein
MTPTTDTKCDRCGDSIDTSPPDGEHTRADVSDNIHHPAAGEDKPLGGDRLLFCRSCTAEFREFVDNYDEDAGFECDDCGRPIHRDSLNEPVTVDGEQVQLCDEHTLARLVLNGTFDRPPFAPPNRMVPPLAFSRQLAAVCLGISPASVIADAVINVETGLIEAEEPGQSGGAEDET